MSERKRVTDTLGTIEPHSSTEDFVKMVAQAALLRKSGEWEDMRIDSHWTNPDAAPSLIITGKRWETDQEMNVRIKREKKTNKKETK